MAGGVRTERGALTLYGAAGSGSAAIEAALVLCGRRYRHVEAASWDAASAQAELATLNPLLQVPTLVLADGTVLSESAAILIHLGLSHPASKLLPTRSAERAQALRGLVYIAANCYAAIGLIDHPERWCDGGSTATHERVRAGTRQRLHRLWQHFADQHRTDTPFLNGSTPGALDLLAAVVSRWAGTRAHLRRARPALAALLQRVDTEPRLAPVFARHWP